MVPSELSRENKLWKDYIDRKAVKEMAETIGRISKKFDRSAFISYVLKPSFFKCELKDRINQLADGLKHCLPPKYSDAVVILIKAAPKLKTFENWALTTFVERYGLDDFDQSIAALKELTKFGTAEFAIRPYILADTAKVLKLLNEWATNENEHIRRLAAEGSRSRGVWVAHIPSFKKNPSPVIEILEKLRADDSLYVRKAVANNLNDISKDNPEAVIKVSQRWKTEKNKHTDWIIKHGCRSLIKLGDPRILEIFGFTSKPKLEVTKFISSKKKVKIGSEVELSCELISQSKKSQKLAVDFRFHFVKSNGKSSPKVFKWAEKNIKPSETMKLSIKQSFQKITTRRYYPGQHRVELIINGQSKAELVLNLMN